jgi:hypothetical protein
MASIQGRYEEASKCLKATPITVVLYKVILNYVSLSNSSSIQFYTIACRMPQIALDPFLLQDME